MDVRESDTKAPGIAWDLLSVWTSTAYCRQQDHKPTSGWKALATALEGSRQERLRDAEQASEFGIAAEPRPVVAQGLTEADLRLMMVHLYRSQEESAIQDILEAKLKDELSYFYFASLGSVEEARQHWPFYLYNLSFPSEAIGRGWPDGVARMEVPMDLVDLRAAATLFGVQITVTRMFEEPLAFKPQLAPADLRGTCHLLLHSRLWGALLAPWTPRDEPLKLEGAVVEVDNEASMLYEAAEERALFIREYDFERRCYVASSGRGADLWVERSSISRLLFTEEDRSKEQRQANGSDGAWANWGNWGTGAGPAHWGGEESRKYQRQQEEGSLLAGIPEGSLEFQVLQEMVRRAARQRLTLLQNELAGRTPVAAASTAAQNAAASVAASQRGAPQPQPQAQASAWQQQEQQEQQQQQQQQQLLLQQQEQQWLQQQQEQQRLQQQQEQQRLQQQQEQQRLQQQEEQQRLLQQQQQQLQEQQQVQQQRQQQQARPAAQQQQASSSSSVIPLQEASDRLGRREALTALCVLSFRAPDERYVSIQEKEFFRLSNLSTGELVKAEADAGPMRRGWAPFANFVLHLAEADFVPDPSWADYENFLPLQKNDWVILEKAYDGDWTGWGYGRKYTSSAGTPRRGYFLLANVTKKYVYLKGHL